MKQIILLLALVLSSSIYAQETTPGEAKIQTNAECGSCKERLEGVLNYTKGVRFAELNMADKNVTVSFNPKKISLNEIRTIISETGYNADDVKANPKARKELPMCCQPGGMK